MVVDVPVIPPTTGAPMLVATPSLLLGPPLLGTLLLVLRLPTLLRVPMRVEMTSMAGRVSVIRPPSCARAGSAGVSENATNIAANAPPRGGANNTTGHIEDSSGGTSGASPRTKSPQSSRKGDWFGYCQYSPTDMLAHDHC